MMARRCGGGTVEFAVALEKTGSRQIDQSAPPAVVRRSLRLRRRLGARRIFGGVGESRNRDGPVQHLQGVRSRPLAAKLSQLPRPCVVHRALARQQAPRLVASTAGHLPPPRATAPAQSYGDANVQVVVALPPTSRTRTQQSIDELNRPRQRARRDNSTTDVVPEHNI